jgi:hypothetical protein
LPTRCWSVVMPLSRTEYLAANLTRAVPTKDRGVLRTVADARDYMLALPGSRIQAPLAAHSQDDPRSGGRRGCEPTGRALFYDGKLDFVALYG